jgi:hypothetical protein
MTWTEIYLIASTVILLIALFTGKPWEEIE